MLPPSFQFPEAAVAGASRRPGRLSRSALASPDKDSKASDKADSSQTVSAGKWDTKFKHLLVG